jgi:hypothetical protein
VDQETWQRLDQPIQRRKATRSGAKSTSPRSTR